MDDAGILLFCIILPIGILFLISKSGADKQRRIEEARSAYAKSLQALKDSPDDSTLRQKTLSLGRRYAAAAREGGKETIFDEMSLMNDLNAVAGSHVGVQSKIQKTHPSVKDRLRQLDELKRDGLVTDEEYHDRRSAILSEI